MGGTMCNFKEGRYVTGLRLFNEGVKIESSGSRPPREFVTFANFINDHYESLRDFLKAFRKAIGYYECFFMDLKGDGRTLKFKFLEIAERLGMLEYERVFDANTVWIRFKGKSSHFKFLGGRWFEISLFSKIHGEISKHEGLAWIHRNVKVNFNDGTCSELDLLFETREEIFVIEAKTGRMDFTVKKYKILAAKLGVPFENFIIAIPGNQEHSHKKSITVMNSQELLDFIKEKLSPL